MVVPDPLAPEGVTEVHLVEFDADRVSASA